MSYNLDDGTQAMADEIMNTLSELDETLAHAYYSAGVAPALRITRFAYSAPRQGLLAQVSTRLGARLNTPLSAAHRALLESGAEQSPEDLALAERMTAVQREALVS
jgi:hypothetical protein